MKIKVSYYQCGFFHVKGISRTERSRMGIFIDLASGSFIHWSYLAYLKKRYGYDFRLKDDSPYWKLLERKKKLQAAKKQKPAFDYSQFFTKNKKPYLFQEQGIDFLYKSESGLLADDVGLGKTLQSIGVMIRAVEERNVDIVIVLCPSPLKFQWAQEIKECLTKKFKKKIGILRMMGEPADRKAKYSKLWNLKSRKVPVVMVNYELLIRDKHYWMQILKRYRKRMVICDEASRIRNTGTATHKQIYKQFKNARYKICLTATPVENGLEDLYGIMRLLDSNLFWSHNFFKRRHLVIEEKKNHKTGYMYKKVVDYKRLEEVKARIDPYYLQRTTDEIDKQLPRIVISNYPIDLTKQQRKVYEEIKDGVLEEYNSDNLLATIIHLRKVCSSLNIFPEYKNEKSAKIEELKILLENELRGKKIIIFSESKMFVKEAIKELKAYKPFYVYGGMKDFDRSLQYQGFRSSKSHTAILIMTGAGERGLNFPEANVVINLDIPYNPARMRQRIGRARRFNSKAKVITVINFFAKDSVEERVFEIFHKKAQLFNKLFSDSFKLTRIDIHKWSPMKLRSLIFSTGRKHEKSRAG